MLSASQLTLKCSATSEGSLWLNSPKYASQNYCELKCVSCQMYDHYYEPDRATGAKRIFNKCSILKNLVSVSYNASLRHQREIHGLISTVRS
jgi:hypothetical protein